MPTGVDATSRYTLDDWTDERAFRKLLRDPNDRYNTRLHYGLPPTPIGNPSLSALQVVIAQKEREFWFYLHDKMVSFMAALMGPTMSAIEPNTTCIRSRTPHVGK